MKETGLFKSEFDSNRMIALTSKFCYADKGDKKILKNEKR